MCHFQAAILAELLGSSRASNELLLLYFPFMGLGILATLRGLVTQSAKNGDVFVGNNHVWNNSKKMA